MTYYDYSKKEKQYVPLDLKYLYANTDTLPRDSVADDDLLGGRVRTLSDKISSLYGQIYQRKDVSKNLVSEIDEELVETSSKMSWYKYNAFVDSRHKSALEKRIDLLEKTKRTELVEYWRDLFRINMYLFQVVDEYKKLKEKMDVLK